MENQIVKFSYGMEFCLNNELFYPAFLDGPSLMRLAFLFKNQFAASETNFEIRARSCAYGKGLEWEIKTLSLYDEMMLLNRVYTFQLSPDWTVTSLHDHWNTITSTTRCQHHEDVNQIFKSLNSEIVMFLEQLKVYYKNIDDELYQYRHLADDSWKVILSNDERGLNYLERIPDPSSN